MEAADALLSTIAAKAPAFQPRSVLPGDDITTIALEISDTVRIGDGLMQRGDALLVTKPGVLTFSPPNRLWVDVPAKKYEPSAGDMVVGVITERHAEEYRVDIGGCFPAVLPALAFDGASKRNRPNLQIGDAVYARVATAQRHLEPELSCTSLHGKRKDWVTGESMFGQLKGGIVFSVSLQRARRLRQPDSPILSLIGKSIPYEVAVGSNGRVWIVSVSVAATAMVAAAVRNSEYLDERAMQVLVERMAAELGERGGAR